MRDLDKTEEFYHGKLGFEVIARKPGRHVFFRVGSSVLLCFLPDATKKEDVLPAHHALGPQHLAFEVAAENYDSIKEDILDARIKITHLQKWKEGSLESFYFNDPDDNVLEVVPVGLWD